MNPSGAESENPDLVAKWRIALPNGLQTIEFEHGETSGKRVVRLNGEEIIRKDWMFSLIGSESFKVGGKSVVINIYADGFLFNYKLTVDGKPIESFVREMNKLTRTWFPTVNGKPHRVVIDTKTMDIYVDGKITETEGEFVENGAENHFVIDDCPLCIKSFSSGVKRKGMLYTLIIGDIEYQPQVEVNPATKSDL